MTIGQTTAEVTVPYDYPVCNTFEKFIGWLHNETEACIYYRGDLAYAVGIARRHKRKSELGEFAEYVMAAAEKHRLFLTQKRLGDNDYVYIARKPNQKRRAA